MSKHVTGWAIVSHVGGQEVTDERYRTNIPDFVAADIARDIVGVPVLISHNKAEPVGQVIAAEHIDLDDALRLGLPKAGVKVTLRIDCPRALERVQDGELSGLSTYGHWRLAPLSRPKPSFVKVRGAHSRRVLRKRTLDELKVQEVSLTSRPANQYCKIIN